MAEYIDKDKLLDELKESAEHHAENSREEQLLLRDRNIVRAQPAADCVREAIECMKKIKMLIEMDNEQHTRSIKLSELKEVCGL